MTDLNWKNIMAFLGAASFLVGTAFAIDSHYAKQEDHVELAQAFQRYVSESRQDKLQERIWELDDRIASTDDRKEKDILERRKRELQAELDKIQHQIKESEKKK